MKKAVITGGTEGLGYETALGLVRQGYAVTVIGRDTERGGRAVEALLGASDEAEARFPRADLSSLAEVRALGEALDAEGPLHLLVNNVGGMYAVRWTSVDGLEGSFVLNHLTPCLLTEALTGALESGAPSRVVQVTSGSIIAAVPDFADVDLPGDYYGLAVTGRAKLANLAWALDAVDPLWKRGITLVVVDPGPAATPNAGAMRPDMPPPALRPMWENIKAGVARPATEAALSIIQAATAAELQDRPGTFVGDTDLRPYVTPQITEAVRALTARVLH